MTENEKVTVCKLQQEGMYCAYAGYNNPTGSSLHNSRRLCAVGDVWPGGQPTEALTVQDCNVGSDNLTKLTVEEYILGISTHRF